MHCISVYLLRVEELREDKIESLVSDNNLDKLNLTYLGESIVAITDPPENFLKDKTYAFIETDYFGGMGEQSAEFFRKGEKVYSNYESNSINVALRDLGIKQKDGMDEFDTIGLGKYRKNEDFNG